MTKRIITLLFLFLMLNILIISNQPKTKPVFNYLDVNDKNTKDFYTYILSFNDINLNTKNFGDYFTDIEMKIIGVFPNINPLYSKKLQDQIGYYAFSNTTISRNLNIFSDFYLKLLNNYGFNDDIENININGIKIDKVKVYTYRNQLLKLINKYPGITYK